MLKNKLSILFFTLVSVCFLILDAKPTFAAAEGTLNIHVQSSNAAHPIEGSYFTITGITDPSYFQLVKTDTQGRLSLPLPVGDYTIRQIATTSARENVGISSIGYSRTILAGQTATAEGSALYIGGDYAFVDSPDIVYLNKGDYFDSSIAAQGIRAFNLNFGPVLGTEKKAGGTFFEYYNNVNTAVPGEYISVYLALQNSFSTRTTHVLKVVVLDTPVVAGDVTIKYLDQNGDELIPAQTINGNVGDTFDTSTDQYQLTIDGYSLDTSKLPFNMTGTFTDTPQTVSYVYTKNPVPAGDVTIQYLDQNGIEISPAQTINGNIGDFFDASTDQYQLTIDGYSLDTSKLPFNMTGTFTDTPQTVSYVYTKNPVPAGDVTIQYLDQNGIEISPAQTINGNIGDSFDASTDQYQLAIDGYSLDTSKLPFNMTGTFTDTAQIVSYVYTKNPVPAGDITIQYLDQNGKQIHSSQVVSGNIGDILDTLKDTYQLTIEGYSLDFSQLPKNITFNEHTQIISYVYTENSAPSPINSKTNSNTAIVNTSLAPAQAKAQLPKTGESDSPTIKIIEMLFLLILTFFTFIRWKKIAK
ncbi:MucBP domain-containing protein [Candidatus Enterococcus dunnyi]|uniref:MucBP domain-containing protein n=1 Tax=Candidatus Enterococcus dunnyi TaxID=1834192 RepID=A0AAQ3W227_9ENTE